MQNASHDFTTPDFRLQPIMRQGTASSIPEAWDHYATLRDAAEGARRMYHDDRVLRVMVVGGDGAFVTWIDRSTSSLTWIERSTSSR